MLQCLMSNEAIVKYFLFEVYKFDLNQTSKFGTKGKLAIAFADLVNEMYLSNDEC